MGMRDSAPIKREWSGDTSNDFDVSTGLGAKATSPGVEAMPGIGPRNPNVSSQPLDADVECPGGPLWSADENDRQDGAWASENFQGKYWVQEPAETVKGTAMGLEPTSDLAGSNPLGEDPGRVGHPSSMAPGEPPAINNR